MAEAGPARGRSEPRATRRPVPGAEIESFLNPWALLNALRRRWKAALLVALPAALVVAALTWTRLPSAWTAFALLSLYHARAIPFFAVVAGPITALNFLDYAAVRLGPTLLVKGAWARWSVISRRKMTRRDLPAPPSRFGRSPPGRFVISTPR